MGTSDDDRVIVQCKCGKKFRLKAKRAHEGFVCLSCGQTIQLNGANVSPPNANSPHWSRNVLWMIWAIPVCIALLGGLYVYNREREDRSPLAVSETKTDQNMVAGASILSTTSTPDESKKDAPSEINVEAKLTVAESAKPIEPNTIAVYWIGPGQTGTNVIRKASADLTDVEEILQLAANAVSLTVDPVHGKFYWTTKQPGKLFSADLNGSNIQELISSGIHGEQYGITVRPDGKVLFLCGHTFISKISVEGWREIPLPVKPLYPTGISVCKDRRSIVWGVADTGRVYECNFEGSDIVQLPGEFSNVNCPVIDSRQKRVYWIDYKTNELLSADLHGNDRQFIQNLPSSPQKSLRIDENQEYLYWGSATAIGRVSLGDQQEVKTIQHGVAGDSLSLGFIAPIAESNLSENRESSRADSEDGLELYAQAIKLLPNEVAVDVKPNIDNIRAKRFEQEKSTFSVESAEKALAEYRNAAEEWVFSGDVERQENIYLLSGLKIVGELEKLLKTDSLTGENISAVLEPPLVLGDNGKNTLTTSEQILESAQRFADQFGQLRVGLNAQDGAPITVGWLWRESLLRLDEDGIELKSTRRNISSNDDFGQLPQELQQAVKEFLTRSQSLAQDDKHIAVRVSRSKRRDLLKLRDKGLVFVAAPLPIFFGDFSVPQVGILPLGKTFQVIDEKTWLSEVSIKNSATGEFSGEQMILVEGWNSNQVREGEYHGNCGCVILDEIREYKTVGGEIKSAFVVHKFDIMPFVDADAILFEIN